MEEQESLERIEKYLRRELPEAERSAFEQELSADPALQREVELHAFALKAIRLEGKAALKARLRQRQFHLPGEAKKNAGHYWRRAAALLGVVSLGAFFWWMNSRENLPQPPPEERTSTQDTLPETQPSETLPTPDATKDVQPEKSPPVADSKPDVDKLFADNFQPYVDEVFKSGGRTRAGDENPTSYEKFVDFYLKGEHEKALAVYEQIAPEVKNNDNSLFFKANSLLATGRANEAAEVLSDIDKGRYVAEAKWYLALSLLKKGEVKNARRHLEKITPDASAVHRMQAEKLLKEIR